MSRLLIWLLFGNLFVEIDGKKRSTSSETAGSPETDLWENNTEPVVAGRTSMNFLARKSTARKTKRRSCMAGQTCGYIRRYRSRPNFPSVLGFDERKIIYKINSRSLFDYNEIIRDLKNALADGKEKIYSSSVLPLAESLGLSRNREISRRIINALSFYNGRIIISSTIPLAEALGSSRKKGVTDYCQDPIERQIGWDPRYAIVNTADSWSMCDLYDTSTSNVCCFALLVSVSYIYWKVLSDEQPSVYNGTVISDSTQVTAVEEESQSDTPQLVTEPSVKPKSQKRKKRRRTNKKELDEPNPCSMDETPFQVVVRKRTLKNARNKDSRSQERSTGLPDSRHRSSYQALDKRKEIGSRQPGNVKRIGSFHQNNENTETLAQRNGDSSSNDTEEVDDGGETRRLLASSPVGEQLLPPSTSSADGTNARGQQYSTTHLEQLKAAQRIRQMIKGEFRQSYNLFVAENTGIPQETLERIFRKHAQSLDETAIEWIEIWSEGVRDFMPLNVFVSILLDVKEVQLQNDLIQHRQRPGLSLHQGFACQMF